MVLFTAYIMFGGRIESYLNPELHFNLIEACHQIFGIVLSVVIQDCGCCYVGGLTTKEKTTAYLLISYFCLKTVKHVNPLAVWWFQIIF